MSQLIDESKVENKKLRKIVQGINIAANKSDLTKLKDLVSKLLDFLDDASSVNLVLYAFSIFAEKYPTLVNDISPILPYLESEETSTRLNAVAILGLYITKHFEEEEEKLETLLHFLEDREQDIRENAAIVVEQLKDQIQENLFSKLPLLLQRLGKENSTVIKEIFIIIINQFVGKDILTTQKIEEFYLEQLLVEKDPSIRELMFSGLEQYYFGKEFKQDPEKKRFDRIKTRKPLLIFHDIAKEAKESGIGVNELKEFYKDERNEAKISGIFELDGKKKLFVEFEKSRLIEYLSRGKIPIKEVMQDLSINLDFINRLIKTLIKNHEIRGYLTEDSFLSSTYIKGSMERDFKTNGVIDLADYQDISDQFIHAILKELQEESKIQGFFTRDFSKYYSVNKIKKELDQQAGKNLIIDLQHYQETFTEDAFAEIEREGETHLFAPFKAGTVHLTHLGKIKIDQAIKDASKLGSVDVKRMSKKLTIPEEILRAYLDESLRNKSGFWTEGNSKFFFYQYFDSAIAKASKAGGENTAQLEELSREFNLPVEDIRAKMDTRKKSIIERIKKADVISFREYMDELGIQSKNEFLSFVDGLGREYLDVGSNLIFDPEKIAQKKAALRNEIRVALDTEDVIRLTSWARRLNVPPSVIEELFNNLIQEQNLNVLKIGEDSFVTQSGMERRMLENTGGFEADALFYDLSPNPLDEIQLQVVGAVVKNLLEQKQLSGVYDDEMHNFMDSTSMAAMDLNKGKAQVTGFIDDTKRQTFAALDQIKAYINGEALGPSQITACENILKALGEKYRQWNADRDRLEHSFGQVIRNHKADLKTISDDAERAQAEEHLNSLEADVNTASTEFKAFRSVIDALTKDIGKVFHLIKTIRRSPENVDAMQERLDELLAQYYLK
ncbi:MAG TPA: hypothetical protein VKK79_22230 [Candidatus Lokiarchaeia archaeon]|nr:hypothetical protein [Candidatus Lokiarchaeia archaeon]